MWSISLCDVQVLKAKLWIRLSLKRVLISLLELGGLEQ